MSTSVLQIIQRLRYGSSVERRGGECMERRQDGPCAEIVDLMVRDNPDGFLGKKARSGRDRRRN